jgi:Aspartyl protease
MGFCARLIVIAACTVVIVGAQTAVPTPAASPREPTQPAVKTPGALLFSSSPFDADIVRGLTYVRGGVNGSRPLDVVLDSGASESIITPQLAQELHLKTEETAAAAGPGTGGDSMLHMVHGATLTLGATTIADQTIAALPIDYIAQQVGVPTDGIFGGNFFTRFVVDEDYAAHAVRLLDSATFAPSADFVSVPVNLGGNVAFTQLAFRAPDGSELSGIFLIDSGLVGDLIFAEPFVKAHPAVLSGKHVDVPSVAAVGGKLQVQMGRIRTLTLGSFVLKEPVAIFPSNAAGVLANEKIAGILGTGVLKRFHVIFDWPHQRMLLAPGPDVRMRSPGNCSGLSLRVSPPDFHRLLVNGVIAGSPAAQAGIRLVRLGAEVDWPRAGSASPRNSSSVFIALLIGRVFRTRFLWQAVCIPDLRDAQRMVPQEGTP